MRALVWHGAADIRCESVPDPEIEDGRDAVIKVTSCAICGSDLHLYDHFMPGMKSGDIMGHETMGEVVEVGRDNSKLKVGDRVVIPFTIFCGDCEQCRRGYYSVCERSNRNGAREIATGVAILASHDPAPWIWGRIGGDAIDLATLASAMRRTPGAMRGAARDFRVPDDMRMPKALRPYGSSDEPTRARPSYM